MLHACPQQFRLYRVQFRQKKKPKQKSPLVNNIVNPVFRRTLKSLFTTTARIPIIEIYLLCTTTEIKILISSGCKSIFQKKTSKSQLLYLTSLNIIHYLTYIIVKQLLFQAIVTLLQLLYNNTFMLLNHVYHDTTKTLIQLYCITGFV